MTENAKSERELVYDGERAHCPRDDCGWWVPKGMEYIYETHRRDHERFEVAHEAADALDTIIDETWIENEKLRSLAQRLRETHQKEYFRLGGNDD